MSDKPTTLPGLIAEGLKRHGYDGLYCADCECEIGSLASYCTDPCMECCMPGYRIIDERTDDGQAVDWHIGPEKLGGEYHG